MNRKKIREKVLDVCNGAGYWWLEDDGYFETNTSIPESMGKVIQGLLRSFDLPDDSRITRAWYLKEYDHPDTIVKMIEEALEYDLD